MKKIFILMMAVLTVIIACSASGDSSQKVIAHRGYWQTEGSAENSIAALRKAHEIGVYGSEFDVHITRDGQVVVFHDDDADGIVIEDSPYSAISGIRLSNGEKIPTLEEYLEVGKTLEGTKLIVEIKEHKAAADEDRCVAAVLKAVRDAGVEAQVEYISFSKHVCDALVKDAPGAVVSYLNGDLTPRQAKEAGYAGIDYEDAVYKKNPQWISEAQDLGLIVNVWTVDDIDDMKEFFRLGINFITTNRPVECKALR